jgi:hypothetical protein
MTRSRDSHIGGLFRLDQSGQFRGHITEEHHRRFIVWPGILERERAIYGAGMIRIGSGQQLQHLGLVCSVRVIELIALALQSDKPLPVPILDHGKDKIGIDPAPRP